MSVVEVSQYNLSPLFDANATDPSAAQNAPGGSFDDYLQRAQSSSAGDGGASDKPREAGKSTSQRAGNTNAKAAQPAHQKKSDDGDDGKEPSASGNASTADSQPEANKDKPAEQAKTGSSTDKKDKNAKKDKNDGGASPAADNKQDAQLQAAASVANGNPQSNAESDGDSAPITPRQCAVQDTIDAAPDGKIKQAADSASLAGAETTSSQATQASAAEDSVAVISGPGQTTVRGSAAAKDGKNLQQPAVQIIGTPAAAANRAVLADGASNGIAADWRKQQGSGSSADDKSQSLTGGTADAAVLQAAVQGAPAGAAAANAVALQAACGNGPAAAAADNVAITPTAVKLPVMPTTPAKDKTDRSDGGKSAGVAPADKAAAAASALQRTGQAGDGAAGSGQSGGDESGSNASGVRFVQRVEQAFAAMSDRGGSVRLRLSPPELGSLRLDISVTKGVMKAHLETETKEAKNLLLDNLPALRERLAQQNIKIQTFDVDLRDPSSGGTPQQTADQSGRGSGGGAGAQRTQTTENNVAAATGQGGESLYRDGRLNVIV